MNTPAVSQEKLAPELNPALALDLIKPDPANPRKAFDEAALKDLAASIKAEGLVQPISVRPNGTGFYIVDGERRHRAAGIAGLKAVPALIYQKLTPADVATIQLVANIQREDLSLPEQCDAVGALVRDIGFEGAVKALGKSESWVSKRANVLKLPEAIKKAMRIGGLADIELATSLGQLYELDKESCVATLAQLATGRAAYITREHVAGQVRWTKEQRKRDEENKKRQEREDAAAKKAAANPKAAKASAKKPVDKGRERERAIAKVKDARKDLRDATLTGIYAGLGIDAKKAESFNSPVSIEYGHDFPGLGSGDNASFPKTADACKFRFHAYGEAGHLKKVANGWLKADKAIVDVQLPALTLEQAQKLQDALKGVKDIDMSFSQQVTGKDLVAIAKRLNPKFQLASAPAAANAKKPAKKGSRS